MKKRIISLLLVFVMIVFSGCGCEHEWEDATCIHPKTCKLCGKTEGELAEHNWEPATCTEPKTCQICGKTEGTAAGHKWEEATIKKPKTCSVCNATEGNPLPISYFDVSYSEFLDAFQSKIVREYGLGKNSGLGYPFFHNGHFFVLSVNTDYDHRNDKTSEWRELRIILIDDSSIEYDSNIAELAINIGIHCAQILDPTLSEDEIPNAFSDGTGSAKKTWSDNYNTLQFWYSDNGFDYYVYDHVRDVGKIGSPKLVAYWYEFRISLSANE